VGATICSLKKGRRESCQETALGPIAVSSWNTPAGVFACLLLLEACVGLISCPEMLDGCAGLDLVECIEEMLSVRDVSCSVGGLDL
jgi:hypothetical protein